MNDSPSELAYFFSAGAFLLLCTVLAIAVWFLFKSGEQGKTKLNGAAGCAIGFALVAIALLMALVATFAIAVSAGRWIAHEIHENGDFGWRIERRGDADDRDGVEVRPLPAPGGGEQLSRDGVTTVVIRGLDPDRVDAVLQEAREIAPGDMASATSIEEEGGERRTRLEIQFFVDDVTDEALRQRLASTWPNGEVEGGGKVEIAPRER